jgi:hypothetical protein
MALVGNARGGDALRHLFVIHRHVAYYRLHNARADLLRDETRIPIFVKRRASARHPKELSGVMFFTGWLVFGFVICLYAACFA